MVQGVESGPQQPPAESAGRSLRILVVDDDDLTRSFLRILLSQEGHIVELAEDGASALEMIKTLPLDLAFMDLFLPDMNGREVCRQVREWEAGKARLPIIALTAYDIPGQPLLLLKAGMDDYIFKPYDYRQISRMINLYAGNKPADLATGDKPPQSLPVGAHRPITLAEGGVPMLDTTNAMIDFAANPEDYKDLLRQFLGSLPERFERMHRDLRDRSFRELTRECHNLKSISASLGALQLSALTIQLENASRDGLIAPSRRLLQQIEECLVPLKSEVDAFLRL